MKFSAMLAEKHVLVDIAYQLQHRLNEPACTQVNPGKNNITSTCISFTQQQTGLKEHGYRPAESADQLYANVLTLPMNNESGIKIERVEIN